MICHAGLPQNHRATVLEVDQQRDEQEKRAEQNQRDSAAGKINRALEGQRPGHDQPPGNALPQNKGVRCQRPSGRWAIVKRQTSCARNSSSVIRTRIALLAARATYQPAGAPSARPGSVSRPHSPGALAARRSARASAAPPARIARARIRRSVRETANHGRAAV